MTNETGKQLIKSAAAVLCVASICVSAIISTNKIAAMIKDTAVPASVQSGDVSQDDGVPSDGIIDSGTGSEAVTDASGAEQTEAPQSGDNQSPSADTGSSQNSSTGSSSQSTTKKTANATMSKAEIINYCNTALNKAKAAKVGYNKKMVREVKGSTDGISPSLIKLVAANKSTTMKKGSADIKDDFPAAGYDWSSKLREQDVASATLKKNGKYYEIRLTLGKEQNPAKGEASSYGRVMSVIDAAEAGNMVPGIKSINMSYHDGYVYAKVDSTTGRLVSAEFSAAADIQAKISIFGDVSVKDIVSTETFTNIVW
ncbi:MAG TPA: hypothetical protein DCY31_03330 [Ruminococcaceae bacterium]|nr:hypothetical protein [Oscillospiraceae bacterium]